MGGGEQKESETKMMGAGAEWVTQAGLKPKSGLNQHDKIPRAPSKDEQVCVWSPPVSAPRSPAGRD